jgi:hypothetical protein
MRNYLIIKNSILVFWEVLFGQLIVKFGLQFTIKRSLGLSQFPI